MLILLLLTINIFYIPLKLTYENYGYLKLSPTLRFLFDLLPQYAFVIDMLLNFNTVVYKNGTLVKSRIKISKIYFKKNFIYDFLTVGPYFIIKILEVNYLDAILLLRTNKIYNISNTLFERSNPNEKQQGIFDLVKLVFIIFLVSHFMGCSFNILAYYLQEQSNSSTWLDKLDQNDEKIWYQHYVKSLYWAVITMVTVGYGDMVPTNTNEYIFVILATMGSCGIFAYSLNQIGTIIGNMTTQKRDFNLKMAQLTKHMQKRGVSKDLQMKVKKYYEYFHSISGDNGDQCNKLLNSLAGGLKREIMIEIYGKLIKTKKIFSLHFSTQFLENLALEMQEVQYGPDYTIFDNNSYNDNLYFIRSGNIQQKRQNKSKNVIRKPINNLKKGDIINEWSFMSDQPPEIAAVTEDVVNLAFIQKDKFLKVLKEFPVDNEKFQMFKDNLNLYKSSRGLGIKCPICERFNHIVQQCPFVNYIPNHDKLMFQYKQSDQEMIRKPFGRYQLKLPNSVKNVDNVRYDVIQFIIDNDNQQQDEEFQGQQGFTQNTQDEDIYEKINRIIQASAYYLNDGKDDYYSDEDDNDTYSDMGAQSNLNESKFKDPDEHSVKFKNPKIKKQPLTVRADRRNNTITIVRKKPNIQPEKDISIYDSSAEIEKHESKFKSLDHISEDSNLNSVDDEDQNNQYQKSNTKFSQSHFSKQNSVVKKSQNSHPFLNMDEDKQTQMNQYGINIENTDNLQDQQPSASPRIQQTSISHNQFSQQNYQNNTNNNSISSLPILEQNSNQKSVLKNGNAVKFDDVKNYNPVPNIINSNENSMDIDNTGIFNKEKSQSIPFLNNISNNDQSNLKPTSPKNTILRKVSNTNNGTLLSSINPKKKLTYNAQISSKYFNSQPSAISYKGIYKQQSTKKFQSFVSSLFTHDNIEEVLDISGKNKKDDQVLLAFDKYKIWKTYFPHNNIDNIVPHFNKKQTHLKVIQVQKKQNENFKQYFKNKRQKIRQSNNLQSQEGDTPNNDTQFTQSRHPRFSKQQNQDLLQRQKKTMHINTVDDLSTLK